MKLCKEVTPVRQKNGKIRLYRWYIVTDDNLMTGYFGNGSTPEIAKKTAIARTNELLKEAAK